LQGRRIHLLGGSPHKQMEFYRYASCYATVISADGNMFQYLSGRGKYWCCGKWVRHPNAGQKPRDPCVTSDCIQWSLRNIRRAWLKVVGISPCPLCFDVLGQTWSCVFCQDARTSFGRSVVMTPENAGKLLYKIRQSNTLGCCC